MRLSSSRLCRGVVPVALPLVLAITLLAGGPPVAADRVVDAGFELDLDLANNRLRVRERDAAAGEWAEEFRVAVGSPAHPTPRGSFSLGRVILRPAWTPGATAAAAGAEPSGASFDSPMGVAKIPFAAAGQIALHGGGDPDVLGKPVSSGCVRASDADLLRLVAWLHLRGALAPTREMPNGELLRDFQRPVRLRVH